MRIIRPINLFSFLSFFSFFFFGSVENFFFTPPSPGQKKILYLTNKKKIYIYIYRSYDPHQSRDSVSPLSGIFCDVLSDYVLSDYVLSDDVMSLLCEILCRCVVMLLCRIVV